MATYDLGRVVGEKGETGKGIKSITLVSIVGLVKTYKITFTDDETFTFEVRDGSDATVDIATTWNAVETDIRVPSSKLTKDTLDTKINTTDIADNLTTTTNGKVLSARQGKLLNDLIGDAIEYIER